MSFNFTASDLLCGIGGATQGCFQSKDVRVIQGLNHDENAVATNKANHEGVEFKVLDLYSATRKEISPCDIVIAGVECTNHSNAKGGQSREADSRAMANEMFRYSEMTGCKVMIIENVREFLDWGPLVKKRDSSGKIIKSSKGKNSGKAVMVPDKKKKGRYFEKWKYKMMNDYGFENYSQKIMVAADYGAATIRKRLFIIFAKKDWNISWPAPTHSKVVPTPQGMKPWVSCGEYIDLNNHGKSIFGRTLKNGKPSPLSDNTLRRIAYGIKKYGIGNSFISKSYSGQENVSSIDDPLGTVTTKDRHAFVSTSHFYTQHYHNSNSVGEVSSPLKTIVTKDEKAFNKLEGKEGFERTGSDEMALKVSEGIVIDLFFNKNEEYSVKLYEGYKLKIAHPLGMMKAKQTYINNRRLEIENLKGVGGIDHLVKSLEKHQKDLNFLKDNYDDIIVSWRSGLNGLSE